VLALISRKEWSRFNVMIWILACLAGLFVLGAMFGLLWLAVDLRKDTRSMSLPIQRASADFLVKDNVLMARQPSTSRRQTTVTTQYSENIVLSTKMPPHAFSAITALNFTVPGRSGSVSAKVNGYVVLPASSEEDGQIVVFLTNHGRLVLSGTVLYSTTESYPQYATMDASAFISAAFPGKLPPQHLRFKLPPHRLRSTSVAQPTGVTEGTRYSREGF